jgi:hypothetical protein
MSLKKCLFCGNPFSGQKRNFEHVIPSWLVKEADLSGRTTRVQFRSKQFDAAMNRIGAKACEACNSAGSNLEEKTKAAYLKIRDGFTLENADVHALLDWLDKIRVGLWLWSFDAGPIIISHLSLE